MLSTRNGMVYITNGHPLSNPVLVYGKIRSYPKSSYNLLIENVLYKADSY